jgi:uncharacterized protein YdaU (DUF1376 family)
MKSGETVVNSGELNRGGAELETSATTPDLSVTGGNELATPKSTKSPAFQFYPNEFIGDEEQALMSLAEAGAYIRLLCRCWTNGSLPDSVPALAQLCGSSPNQMTKMWPAVKKCFKLRPDGRWIHPRLERERQKQANFRQRQTDNARGKWGDTPGDSTRSQRLHEARQLGRHTAFEWAEMLTFFDGKCVACGSADRVVKDHITPIYQGGSDSIANLQPLCLRCNQGKGPDSTDHRVRAAGSHRMPAKWLPRTNGTPALHLQSSSSSSIETTSKERTEAAATSPTVLEFPTVGSGGSVWSLTQSQESEWGELYPALSILDESRKALAWVSADPVRRKTAKGMPRFLVGWFNRANDRGGARTAQEPSRPPGGHLVKSAWECPHEQLCGSQSRCADLLLYGTERYPLRVAK